MNTTICISFFAIHFFVSLAFGQFLTPDKETLLLDQDYYSQNYLSTKAAGRGYTGIASENDVSGITINPASLNQKTKFQFYGSYVFKTNVPWLQRITNNIVLKQIHPTLFAGGSYKISDAFTTGIFFANNQSQRFDLGMIEITTINDPDGTGEFVHAYNDISVSTLGLPVVYSYKETFRMGVNINYVFFFVKKNGPGVSKEKFQKFIPDIGLLYKPVRNFSIGVSFTPSSEETVKETGSIGDSSFTHIYSQPNKFPMKISGGLLYSFEKFPLTILADLRYKDSSVEENFKNRLDFNFGLEFRANDKLTLRSGMFTLADNRAESLQYVDPVGQYSQVFGTIGGTFSTGKFNLTYR